MTFARKFALALLACSLSACSHGAKRTTPELSSLQGKKVALISVDGEPTARRVVEVALINQLTQRGTFILISKEDLEAARMAPSQDPMDYKGIAKRAGADYALRARVLQFDGDTHEGYSAIEYDDSVLAQEQGESARKAERLYKVESIVGHVRIQLDFTDVISGENRSAIAEAEDTVTAEGKDEAAHLPPKLRFLEKLCNQAFAKFFDQYN
jgi:hypothetical protein